LKSNGAALDIAVHVSNRQQERGVLDRVVHVGGRSQEHATYVDVETTSGLVQGRAVVEEAGVQGERLSQSRSTLPTTPGIGICACSEKEGDDFSTPFRYWNAASLEEDSLAERVGNVDEVLEVSQHRQNHAILTRRHCAVEARSDRVRLLTIAAMYVRPRRRRTFEKSILRRDPEEAMLESVAEARATENPEREHVVDHSTPQVLTSATRRYQLLN
jgi:hypothetical protein